MWFFPSQAGLDVFHVLLGFGESWTSSGTAGKIITEIISVFKIQEELFLKLRNHPSNTDKLVLFGVLVLSVSQVSGTEGEVFKYFCRIKLNESYKLLDSHLSCCARSWTSIIKAESLRTKDETVIINHALTRKVLLYFGV